MISLLHAFAKLLAPELRREMGPQLDAALEDTWIHETAGRGRLARIRVGVAMTLDLLKQIVVSRRRSNVSPTASFSPQEPDNLMTSFLTDIAQGARALVRTPMTSLMMLLTLAIGIGGTTAVFTLVNAELVRPLPYVDAGRLVELTFEIDGRARNFSALNLADVRDHVSAFAAVTGFDDRKVFNLTSGDEPVRLYGAAADAAFFSTLGVDPLLGRTFVPGDDQAGSPRVVVVGEAVWRGNLGSDPDIIGRSLLLNDLEYTVIGVAPSTLKIPSAEQLWVPLATHPYGDDRLQNRGETILEAVARLAPGVDMAAARSELATVSARVAADHPDFAGEVTATSLRDALTGNNRGLLTTLTAAVCALLLLACVNVSALQLTRASARRHELGVRTVLGATRGRLARHMLGEALVLCAVAGALGLGVAAWSRRIVLATLPGRFPRLEHVGIDSTVLLLVVIVTLGTTILFAIVPAFFAAPARVIGGGDARTGPGRAQRRTRRLLAIAEIGMALALLVNAGLLTRSLVNLGRVDSGYDASGILTASVSLPESRYDAAGGTAFFDELLASLNRLGPVESAAAINRLPVSGGTNIATFFIEGRDEDYEAASHVRMISPRYFETLGIPVMAGRDFSADEYADRGLVAIIDEEFAARHWPDSDPLGARVQPGRGAPWFQVIGIVGATRHWGPREAPEPTIYAPYTTVPESTMMIALRADAPTQQVADLRQAVWAIDPDIPVQQIRTMDDALDSATLDSRASATVFSMFSGFAFLLALLGVYGLLGESVAQRRHEVGVRVALGADRRSVRRLILGEGFRLSVAGVVVGVALAMVSTRAIASQLFGVGALDPSTLAVVAVGMGLAAVVAAAIPARRATRIDPVHCLRGD